MLLSRIDELLAAIFRYAVIISMTLITVVVFVQVVFRYVLELPLSWSEEVARFGFVWLVFLGAGLLTRMGDHIRVSSFLDAFPERLRDVLAIVIEIAIVLCGLIYFVGGFRIARNEWGQLSPAIDAPMGVVYLVIPLSAVFIIMWSLVRLVRCVIEFRAGGAS
jgi:TRAP-type transport system small permease protein